MAHTPAVAVGTLDASFRAMAPQSTEVPVNQTSNATYDKAPALAVPVKGGSRASRKVAPEGNEQEKANALAGVSKEFLHDFMLRVLPQFGIDRNALTTPKTRGGHCRDDLFMRFIIL